MILSGLETSFQKVYRYYWHTSRLFWVFVVSMIVCVLNFFWVFGSLQTSLLCIMEELAGGGYVAVAVSVSERVSDS